MKTYRYIFLSLIVVMFSACGNKNRFDIDSSENRVDVKINRFDTDMLNIGSYNTLETFNRLKSDYPQFLPIFLLHIADSTETDEEVAVRLLNFVSSPLVTETNKMVRNTFKDVSGIEYELSDAFTYIHHYFPNITLPEIYFFISGLNFPMMANGNFSVLGVGADFYLGKDYPPYRDVVYDYMLINMDPDRLPIDVVAAVLLKNFPYNATQNRLLDNMIYNGKIVYLLSIFMKYQSESNLFGYTPSQMEWVNTNEKEIWRTIIANKDLFTTDTHVIGKYINDAPFTAPISQQSPGKVGIWMGYKLVESYMQKNRNTTLPQLMQMDDYQSFLEKSGYRY